MEKKKSAFLALCEGNPLVIGGFPLQRASDALISHEQTVEQAIETAMIWDAVM